MHPIVSSIRSLLDAHSVPYEYMEHDAGITSKDMARIRGRFSLSEGAKALILAVDDDRFIQVVVPGDKKFENSKLRKVVRSKHIRFASSDDLSRITNGILPGAIPPFGVLFNLSVYADKGLFANEYIVFNCGERTASIAMRSDDYRCVVQPTVVDIAE